MNKKIYFAAIVFSKTRPTNSQSNTQMSNFPKVVLPFSNFPQRKTQKTLR